MKQFVYLLVLIFMLSSCQGKRTTEETSPNPVPQKVKQQPAPQAEENAESRESTNPVDCNVSVLFQDVLELPLEIDNEFLMAVSEPEDLPIIPYQCVGDGNVDIVDGLPSGFYHPYGKILLDDSMELFLVIRAMNPDNPLDMYFVSASVFRELDGRLVDEVKVAKYHAYSGTIEHVYCTIREDGTVYQHHRQTASPDGVEEVFNVGDTLFSLI